MGTASTRMALEGVIERAQVVPLDRLSTLLSAKWQGGGGRGFAAIKDGGTEGQVSFLKEIDATGDSKAIISLRDVNINALQRILMIGVIE